MSPFQFAGGGSPLFKTTGNEPVEAPPINAPSGMSPFSMTSASPTNLALTVGDVMNQLPPELVRGGALPAEQSINLPPTLLENALRSGQAAVPVFEIYRVCPALFQTPVSPQDPRTVALPAAKLPGLIASARHAGQSGAGMAGSPFAAATPAPASPFGAAPASPFSGMVSPFGMPAPQAAPAAEPARPVAESAPPAPSVFPVSPFGTMASGPSTTPSQPLVPAPAPIFSPFAAQAATPPAPAAPEPALPAAPASPFAAMNGALAAMPSPFALAPMAAPAASPSPFAAAAVQMPSLFAPAAGVGRAPESQESSPPPAPFAAVPPQPAIQPAASSPFAQDLPATPAITGLLLPKNDTAAPPQVSGAKTKLSLAHALQGYSVEELGFDSKNIPSWVITQFDQSEIQQQPETGQILVSLATLIEGVSDLGFRNMLGGARRDFQIQLDPRELLHGQTGASMPASQYTAPPASVAPMQAIQPVAPPTHGGMMTIMPSGAPSQAPTIPTFQNAAPAPEPAAPASPIFQAAFAPASQAPAAQAPTAPLQPVMGAVNAFATASTSPALSALPGIVKAFDPFAAATPKNEAPGLSSAQLLGQGASVPASFLPHAQGTQPLRDPFAAKNTVPMPEAAPMTAEERKPTVPLFAAQHAPAAPAAPEAAATASEPLTPMPAIQPLPVFFTPKDEPVAKPAAQPAAAPTASTSSVSRQSFLGLNPVDTETDQLLLRALLSTEEMLDAKRVVEMVGSLPGLSACVCLHRSEVISHVDPSVTEAATFSHQAGDIARQLRALAPLIGIEGAETFTLNASGKLITFCFPGAVTVGVLHAGEPTTGLRDKVTLIARELARMLG
ncbi:MAG: hypothetical protein IPK32_07540 [Verrucomicrobiaceae bacterium]|nr:hypothetical protein [Verrucomicrobiaceae bacterium]